MIPNVYMSWCKRRAECKWCMRPITAGTPMVLVFFWNKGAQDGKKFNVKLYFHPQCWVEQGLDYLKMNPYVPYIRSRKLELTVEEKKQRYILLRRKCSLDQRKRNLADTPDRTLTEARLNKEIAKLMLEIVKVGGIPKRWVATI